MQLFMIGCLLACLISSTISSKAESNLTKNFKIFEKHKQAQLNSFYILEASCATTSFQSETNGV